MGFLIELQPTCFNVALMQSPSAANICVRVVGMCLSTTAPVITVTSVHSVTATQLLVGGIETTCPWEEWKTHDGTHTMNIHFESSEESNIYKLC